MISRVLPAYSYLMNERKINEETILKFHLGYVAPDGETYIDADFLDKLPVLDKRFYHSTMFPIFDLYNNIIGVSCRPLVQKIGSPKYLNTSYEKSEHLYGLSETWKDCLKEQTVYIVEGNLSLLTSYQAGIKNCVAMLGSKLSLHQVCLLSRFVKKIILVPDADKAGQKLIEKMQENIPTKLYDSDVKFTYVELPAGQDPDDYFKVHSMQDFLGLGEQEL